MDKSLSGKRLLVVEEVLKDPIGHWYEYVRSVVEMNRADGAEAISVVHSKVEPDIAAEINAIAAFPRSNWDGDYNSPGAITRWWGAVRHNWLVYRTMSRIVQAHGPFDCLFAPTVWTHHIWGWRLLLARHGKSIGRMVLLFRFNPGVSVQGSDVPLFSRSMGVLKWGMKSFDHALGKGQVAFATDSTRLARQYALLCGITPQLFPSPRVAPFPDAPKQAKGPDEPIVFSTLGPARFDKGIDLVQQAIKLCLVRGLSRPVRFVIQWNHPLIDSDGKAYEPDEELLRDPRVTFIRQALDSDAYAKAIAETDCMLLPYRHRTYSARISGVAVEAATAGIAMIHTRDTWIGDLVDSVGVGIGIEDGDVAALAEAIDTVLEEFESFRLRGAERQKDAVAAHSAEAFQKCLWGRS